MLQNQRFPHDTYINNDFVNVINTTKMKYLGENSEQTGNIKTKI